MNNIYNKLVELQWQLPHPNPHMNTGDVIQIEVPDFDPDIDEALPTSTDQHTNDPVTQGSVTPTLKSAEKVIECRTPAPSSQDIDTQEVDWPDAIPVEIQLQYDQQIEQSIPTQLTLDDDKYYQEVDRVYHTYGTPLAQDYRLANQAPSPC